MSEEDKLKEKQLFESYIKYIALLEKRGEIQHDQSVSDSFRLMREALHTNKKEDLNNLSKKFWEIGKKYNHSSSEDAIREFLGFSKISGFIGPWQEVLEKSLYHDDSEIVNITLKILSGWDNPKAIELLTNKLYKEQDIDMIKSIIYKLKNIGGINVIEQLNYALFHLSEDVRKTAANQLRDLVFSQFYHKEKMDIFPIDSLCEALKDSNHSVREYVHEMLARIGDVKAIEALIEYYKNQDYDDERKYEIPRTLGRIGSKKHIRFLIDLLNENRYSVENNKKIRVCSALALGKLKDISAIEPLIELLKMESLDLIIRQAAAWALGEINNIKAYQAIKENAKKIDNAELIALALDKQFPYKNHFKKFLKKLKKKEIINVECGFCKNIISTEFDFCPFCGEFKSNGDFWRFTYYEDELKGFLKKRR